MPRTLLTDAEVAAALSSLPAWSRDGAALRRAVEFPTFPEAIDAVVRVAAIAESLDHHPDIDIRWRTVTFVLSTHSAGGITPLDVDLAQRIDAFV
ncbi:MAG: putative pterin-4-alpha-carbinolamine dehydratase [Frankiales bacterium]|nr:putative pterin-4-alpha-carbinolamine dehydratase [Frankiales bacterium]